MTRKTWLFVVIAAMLAVLTGCGGSGEFDDANPDGAFNMSLSPSADGFSSKHLAVEIDSEKGVITSGYARYLQENLTAVTSTSVEGTTDNGNFHAEIDFGSFGIVVDAQFTGIGWIGTYSLFDGSKLIETGDVNIDRASETASIQGIWEGELNFSGKIVEISGEIEQKGNLMVFQGQIGGVFHVTFDIGSVVGNTMQCYAQPDIAGYQFFGEINAAGTRIEGEGTNGNHFTFVLEKIVK